MNDLWPLGLTCSPCKMMLCTCPSGFQRNHFFPGGNRWSSGLARCHVMYTFKQNKEHAKFTTGEDICKPSNKPSAGYKEGNVPSLRPHLLDYTRDGRLCTIIFPNNTIYWNNTSILVFVEWKRLYFSSEEYM